MVTVIKVCLFLQADHEGATDPPVPSKEDIPTFDEWKKKVMEVEEKKSKRWHWLTCMLTELRVHQRNIACEAVPVFLLHQYTLTRTSIRTHFCLVSQSSPSLFISLFITNFFLLFSVAFLAPIIILFCKCLLTFVGSVAETACTVNVV